MSVGPGYVFGPQERPTRKTLQLFFQPVLEEISIVDMAMGTGLKKGYVNGSWPIYGSGGMVGAETGASGFNSEGALLMDAGGRWWVRTRWGETRFFGPLGLAETRRYHYQATQGRENGAPLSLINANVTTQTAIRWTVPPSTARTIGVTQESALSSYSSTDEYHPRVSLWGMIPMHHTGSTYGRARINLIEPSWLGFSSQPPTSQAIESAAGHVMAEVFGLAVGNADGSADYDPNAAGQVWRAVGIFFGTALPARNSSVAP